MRSWLALAVVVSGCSSALLSPEEEERQRLFETAIAPCKKKYPSIREIELDQQGQIHAQAHGSALDLDGFRRCAADALTQVAEKRPYGAGRLAANAGPASASFTPAGTLMLVSVQLNGAAATMLLDTGSAVTVVRPEFAQRLGITVPANAPRRYVRVAGGEHFSVPFVQARLLAIGKAAVEGIDVGVTDTLVRGFPLNVDGILGANYLTHFRMTIDRPSRRIGLEPAGVADPRQRPGRE